MSIDAELHEPVNSERRPRGSQASQPAIDALLTSLRTALPSIQARAPRYDAEAAYPAEDVAALREMGALRAFAEPDVAPLDLMEALRLVGRANLSVGRIFEGHVNAAALIRWYGDVRQRRALDDAVGRGQVFGVWNTEAPPGVRIVDGKRGKATLVGAKTFATGAGSIDWAIVTGALPDGGAAMVIADAGVAERADASAGRPVRS
jgi:alkylation response protein AidB-like acyl-CoA dehydrogenase